MAGIGISIDIEGIEQLNVIFERLSSINATPVMTVLGRLLEEQTVSRIKDEKSAPNGGAWPQWSPRYEAKRHSNQSLLENEGHLVDSIQSVEGRDSIEVGTNLVYARRHQYGDPKKNIPQRQFLGVSSGNSYELQKTLEDWFYSHTTGM